jgi:hypothetical protein
MPDPSSTGSAADSKQIRQELLEAQVALDQGDFRTVRRKLSRLTDPGMPIPAEVQPEVDALRRTMKNDPVAMLLAAGCLVFFVLVVWHYVF